jgi:hypothetical protein
MSLRGNDKYTTIAELRGVGNHKVEKRRFQYPGKIMLCCKDFKPATNSDSKFNVKSVYCLYYKAS